MSILIRVLLLCYIISIVLYLVHAIIFDQDILIAPIVAGASSILYCLKLFYKITINSATIELQNSCKQLIKPILKGSVIIPPITPQTGFLISLISILFGMICFCVFVELLEKYVLWKKEQKESGIH